MLMVIVACSAFMGGVTRKPVVAAALLLLCFPLTGMAWGVAAAFVGAKLPLPPFAHPTEKPAEKKERHSV